MANYVTRLRKLQTITANKVEVEGNSVKIGEKVSVEIENARTIDNDRALALLAKKHGTATYVNIEVTTKLVTYGMKAEKFYELAEVMDKDSKEEE